MYQSLEVIDERFIETELYRELRHRVLMEGLQLERDIIKEAVKSVNTTIRQSLDVHIDPLPAFDDDHDVDPRRFEEERQIIQDEMEGLNDVWGEPPDYYY
eukprot:6212485-Pleurochrysis_carterae.AAC.2